MGSEVSWYGLAVTDDENSSGVESADDRATRLEVELRELRSEVRALPASNRSKKVGIVAGAASVIGSFLPWASVGPFSVNGTSGDGAITLVMGLIAVGFAFRLPKFSKVILVLGALVALTGIYDIANISSNDDNVFSASIGVGLIVTTIGGLALVAAFFLSRSERKGSKDK